MLEPHSYVFCEENWINILAPKQADAGGSLSCSNRIVCWIGYKVTARGSFERMKAHQSG